MAVTDGIPRQSTADGEAAPESTESKELPELAQVLRFPGTKPLGFAETIDRPDCDVSNGCGCGVTSNGWEPDALTAHVRICEGTNSIGHGSNIVTPHGKPVANGKHQLYPKHKRVRSTHPERRNFVQTEWTITCCRLVIVGVIQLRLQDSRWSVELVQCWYGYRLH